MAQRTLDSAFWDDERIASLSFPERLLYACMFTDASLSDDYGRLPAHPRILRKHAFGYDDGITVEQVQEWRDNIIAKMGRSVVFYRVDGQEYICLTNFQKWQGLRYRRKSNTPAPDDPGAVVLNISENFRNLPQDFGKFPMGCVVLSSVEESSVVVGSAEAAENSAKPATTPAKPAREQRMERLFELVRASGVELNSLMAEQYLDLMDECESDFRLLEEAFADAAGAGRAPTPKYLRSIVDRCAREHCRPGQWARGRRPSSNGARASPPGGGPPGSDDEIMPSGLTRRQERLNAIAQAEIAEEVSRGQARAPG